MGGRDDGSLEFEASLLYIMKLYFKKIKKKVKKKSERWGESLTGWGSVTGFGLYLLLCLSTRLLPEGRCTPPHTSCSIDLPTNDQGPSLDTGDAKVHWETFSGTTYTLSLSRKGLDHDCSTSAGKGRTEPKASTWRSVRCCAVTSAALSASRED